MAGLVEKFKEMWAPSDEYYEDEYDEREENYEEDNQRSKPKERKNFGGSRVVNLHGSNKIKVVLTKPDRFSEEIKNIADELLQMHTIVLNLEGVVKAESRRIIDFLSGVAYAHGGKIKMVSTDTFVVTPHNVDLEGDDILGELENHGICF